jgi:hypothetical protein
MRKFFLCAVAAILAISAVRAAAVAAVDFGEVPLRLNLAIWFFGVLCAGFAAHAVSVAQKALHPGV